MELGTAIQNIRKSIPMTQMKLAKAIGVSNNTISSIELNNTFPHKKTISLICKALKISEAKLLLSCVEDHEVSEDRREVFKALKKVLIENM